MSKYFTNLYYETCNNLLISLVCRRRTRMDTRKRTRVTTGSGTTGNSGTKGTTRRGRMDRRRVRRTLRTKRANLWSGKMPKRWNRSYKRYVRNVRMKTLKTESAYYSILIWHFYVHVCVISTKRFSLHRSRSWCLWTRCRPRGCFEGPRSGPRRRRATRTTTARTPPRRSRRRPTPASTATSRITCRNVGSNSYSVNCGSRSQCVLIYRRRTTRRRPPWSWCGGWSRSIPTRSTSTRTWSSFAGITFWRILFWDHCIIIMCIL